MTSKANSPWAELNTPNMPAIPSRPGTMQTIAKDKAMLAGELLSAFIAAFGYRNSSQYAQDSCHTPPSLPPSSTKVACKALVRGGVDG